MNQNVNEMSMLEVAEQLIKRKIKPQKFTKIAKEVCEIMGIPAESFEETMAQFYTDLTLSGKFVTVGEDKWDLKSRQKYDVASYDSYDIEFIEDELEVVLDDEFADRGGIPSDNILIDVEAEREEDDYDTDAKENEDSYTDVSDAEIDQEKNDQFEGLTIYQEEELT